MGVQCPRVERSMYNVSPCCSGHVLPSFALRAMADKTSRFHVCRITNNRYLFFPSGRFIISPVSLLNPAHGFYIRKKTFGFWITDLGYFWRSENI